MVYSLFRFYFIVTKHILLIFNSNYCICDIFNLSSPKLDLIILESFFVWRGLYSTIVSWVTCFKGKIILNLHVGNLTNFLIGFIVAIIYLNILSLSFFCAWLKFIYFPDALFRILILLEFSFELYKKVMKQTLTL